MHQVVLAAEQVVPFHHLTLRLYESNDGMEHDCDKVPIPVGVDLTEEGTMYAVTSALIFAAVAIGHLIRLLNQWTVQLGPFSVPMWVSWVGLLIPALLSIWGFMQYG